MRSLQTSLTVQLLLLITGPAPRSVRIDRTSGAEIGASSKAPDFTGTVSEWYETLAETINDVSAQIHRKTLRGGANFVVCWTRSCQHP